jgi:hypothetical protein
MAEIDILRLSYFTCLNLIFVKILGNFQLGHHYYCFCRYFILFTSLVLIRGVTNTRITQLYSGFGPCRFWVLKCWRMPKAHDC